MSVFSYTDVGMVILASLAVSYGWAIRGTIIGHEKGAMLPGAILGFVLAHFSGADILSGQAVILAAAGACGCYFGGSVTYGETLGMLHDKYPPDRFWWPMFGLFIKGGNWFGITGAVLGLTISAGIYGVWEKAAIVAGVIVVRQIGVRIFNKPHLPKKGLLPRIYFSRTRPENWGGNLFIFVFLMIYAAVKGDSAAFILGGFGYLGGGIGFPVGQYIQIATKHFRIMPRLQKGGYISPWKGMEFALGGFGGMFIALGFVLFKGAVMEQATPRPDSGEGFAAAVIWIALAAVVVVARAALAGLFSNPSSAKGRDKLVLYTVHAADGLVSIFVPMFLVLCRNHTAAQLLCGGYIMWLVIEVVLKKHYKNFRLLPVIRIVLISAVLAMVVIELLVHSFTARELWFIQILGYMVITALGSFGYGYEEKRGKFKGFGLLLSYKSLLTVNLTMVIQIAYCLAFGL